MSCRTAAGRRQNRNIRDTFGPNNIHTRIEYYKGSLRRMDTEQNGTYYIGDAAKKRFIFVDPSKRGYAMISPGILGQGTDESLYSGDRNRDARHRRKAADVRPPCAPFCHHRASTNRVWKHTPPENKEIVTDGWYVDLPISVPNHSRIGSITVLALWKQSASDTENQAYAHGSRCPRFASLGKDRRAAYGGD